MKPNLRKKMEDVDRKLLFVLSSYEEVKDQVVFPASILDTLYSLQRELQEIQKILT